MSQTERSTRKRAFDQLASAAAVARVGDDFEDQNDSSTESSVADDRAPGSTAQPSESKMRSLLARQNKKLFEDIKHDAAGSAAVLQQLKDYSAVCMADKVEEAESLSDLKVSYFHYGSQAFQRFLLDIYNGEVAPALPPSKRRKYDTLLVPKLSAANNRVSTVRTESVAIAEPSFSGHSQSLPPAPAHSAVDLTSAVGNGSRSAGVLSSTSLPASVKNDFWQIQQLCAGSTGPVERLSKMTTTQLRLLLANCETIEKTLTRARAVIQDEFSTRARPVAIVWWKAAAFARYSAPSANFGAVEMRSDLLASAGFQSVVTAVAEYVQQETAVDSADIYTGIPTAGSRFPALRNLLSLNELLLNYLRSDPHNIPGSTFSQFVATLSDPVQVSHLMFNCFEPVHFTSDRKAPYAVHSSDNVVILVVDNPSVDDLALVEQTFCKLRRLPE